MQFGLGYENMSFQNARHDTLYVIVRVYDKKTIRLLL